MDLLSYKDLKRKVWDLEKCCGCGACVGVCPTEALYFNGESRNPTSNDYCKVTRDAVPCGACYNACPRTEDVCSDGLGNIISIYESKATIQVPRAQSGGVASAILAAAFESGLIDGAIVMGVDRWTQKSEPWLIETPEAVLTAAGSRYVWAPLLKVLRYAIEEKKLQKVAVVGTPCVSSAVSKIRQSNVDVLSIFKNAIRFSLGLFCTEIFTDKLLEQLQIDYGIKTWEIESFDVKGKFVVRLSNGDTLEIPLKDLSKLKKSGCDLCVDFTSEDADLSLGSVGAQAGHTVAIVRTDVGEGLLKLAENRGYVELKSGVDITAIAKIGSRKKGIPLEMARAALGDYV